MRMLLRPYLSLSLLLPFDCSVEARDLHLMCVEVNETLEQEDILSDSIYIFDDETKQISISKGEESNGQT